MRTISVGMTVNYVAPPKTEGAKPSVGDAEVVEVIGGTSAMLDIGKKRDGNNLANASHSLKGEPNTFHFTDEADIVVKNMKAGASSANGATSTAS